MNELKQGAYWTDPANQVVWGWVERYHVGIGGWSDNMRVRVEDRKEAWELVPERTCRNKARYGNFRCGTCAAFLQVTDLDEDPNLLVDGVGHMPSYCPNCGAKVVEA